MLNICFWIIFGFATGWAGALLNSGSERQALSATAAGICGGLVGGVLMQSLANQPLVAAYNPQSIVGATIFAAFVVAIATIYGKREMSR